MKWKEFLLADNSINVIDPDRMDDYELFFGPLTEEDKAKPFHLKPKKISDVLVALGLVESRTWCRKNNWDWELQPGWTDVKFGSRKVRLCILTDFEVKEEGQ